MKKEIITDIKYLKQRSEEITISEVDSILNDLKESLDLKKGVGLSAIQIGIPKQVGFIKIKDKEIVLINPNILEKENRFRMQQEGCLSLPGLYIDTIRYEQIILENNGRRYIAYGLEAVAIQHEIDHMNGILILDRKWRKR